MAGLGIALFTDEHVHPGLAPALRQRGYDAQSCHEANRHNQRISDEAQLDYATQSGRAILTNNITDFYQLDHDWKAAQRQHAGIIVYAGVRTVSELVRRVEVHMNTYDRQMQQNALLWLAP